MAWLDISLTLVCYVDIIVSVIAVSWPSASCNYPLSLPSYYAFSGARICSSFNISPSSSFSSSIWTQDLISTPAQTCNVVTLTEEVMLSTEAITAPSPSVTIGRSREQTALQWKCVLLVASGSTGSTLCLTKPLSGYRSNSTCTQRWGLFMQLPQEGAVCLKGATGQGAMMLDLHVRTPLDSQRGVALQSRSWCFE